MAQRAEDAAMRLTSGRLGGRVQESISTLLVAWQETAVEAALERLVRATQHRLAVWIAAVLRRHGVLDQNAVDDAITLVFDHVRRLPGAAPGERPVASFDPARCRCGLVPACDPGWAYLRRLAHDRALDVARARRTKNGLVFSDLARPPADWLAAGEVSESQLDGLQRLLPQLAPRERAVIEMLLDGKTQAVIAHRLDVGEGTVSRLRSRAVEQLREQLASS